MGVLNKSLGNERNYHRMKFGVHNICVIEICTFKLF